MSVMKGKLRLLLLLCCLWPAVVPAQNEAWEDAQVEDYAPDTWQEVPDANYGSERYKQESISRQELDREAWRKATQGMDFSRSKKNNKDNSRGNGSEDAAGGGNKLQKNPFSSFNKETGVAALKVLVIIIAAIAFFFLIRSLLGLKKPRNRKLKTADLLGLSIEQIEDRFQELELEDYIRQAVARGDYPLAVRLYFLAALKELSARKLIYWKKDKTNFDYLREMRGSRLLPAFQEITYIFEWVWYGQRSINKEDFERIEPKMKRFADAIAAGTPAANA